jgi:Ala-tRNA(Pro) deacylase
MRSDVEQRVCDRLTALGIAYDRHEHPPIATVEEAAPHWAAIDATHCKNLFLRNQKGTRHYLVIVAHRKRVNLRQVADQIGDGKLSFASAERLMSCLGLAPGSVSPFGLINDRERHVRVFLDRDLRGARRISFHPNVNTVTLTLAFSDFERFLSACGNLSRYIDIAASGSEAPA